MSCILIQGVIRIDSPGHSITRGSLVTVAFING